MDIQDLRIFTRVAAVQNLSMVSSDFSLTPGTISKRLQALEDELGVRLFARSTRSIRITEEGEIFLEHAQRMLSEYDAARASVDGNASHPKGRLKISLPSRVGGLDMAAGLSRFLAAYPEIDVVAEIGYRGPGCTDDGFDLIVRTGVLQDSALIARRLADDPMLIVAAPEYLKLKGAPVQPQDLEKHSCLVHGDAAVWPFKRKSMETSVRVSGRLRANDLDVLHRLALDGHGFARLPAALVRDNLKAGYLVSVLTDYDTTGESAVWAIFAKSRHMLPRLRVLIDFLSDWVKDSSRATGKLAAPAVVRTASSAAALKKRNPMDRRGGSPAGAEKPNAREVSGSAAPKPRRPRGADARP